MGGPTIEVRLGDITTVDTEAIVNAANNQLWMGSGVAGAIKRAGGEEIEREAVARGPIVVGEAIVTRAGRLPYRAVIHAAAMGYTPDGSLIPATAERVYAATRAALARCFEHGLRSVAFPALGTGVGGLEHAVCAREMVRAVCDHAATGAELPERVVFVVRDEGAAHAFAEAIAARQCA
ncbi:MAG: macro domain-containing protein [Thermomicrobium sp.]|nr:macro domain-containing protein [Thermomicrobium sp.]MDW7981222.1 macro domain-containing protein [Thermomicrobium sp.]